MTKKLTVDRRIIAALFASALTLAGCGGKAASKAQTDTENRKNPQEISPNEDLRKRIQIGTPSWENVGTTLRVAGHIEADGTRMARVSAPVTGRILEMKVIEGQHVNQGDVLATVYTTELSTASSEFLKAQSLKQVSDRAVNRAKQLLDAGVIGSAELQRREAELQQATVEVAAVRERLRILGMDDAAINALQQSRGLSSITQILSSIEGIVLERKATIGQIVQAVEPVFVIADLSNVWLVADVPEQNAGAIRVGKAAEAEIPALAGQKIHGALSFVNPMVNQATGTVGVRMNLPNPQRIYKPWMLTTMTLIDGAERRLVVPAAAVVRDGNADCVFVQSNTNTFILRTISAGEELAGKRVILDGLQQNDRVVIDGAFHLNNERKRLALGSEESS